jgi:hypothetical protein
MLTNARFLNLYRAHNAIANVLSGRTADGTDTIPHKVSFTDNAQARAAAAHQMRLILCHCHTALELRDITPLTIKLLWYLTRTGRRTSEDILSMPVIPIIHAIKHAPHKVRERESLFTIMRRYQHHRERERAKQWTKLSDTVPPRTPLWTDGVFTLEEATDPRHLVNDTLALGHCVGSLHHRMALAHLNIPNDHPEAVKYLHYWLKIKKGESRIVTLLEAGTPRITIDFHPATNTILAAQGKITDTQKAVPLPGHLKAPLFAAIKVLPVGKKGGRLLESLIFDDVAPKQRRLPPTAP